MPRTIIDTFDYHDREWKLVIDDRLDAEAAVFSFQFRELALGSYCAAALLHELIEIAMCNLYRRFVSSGGGDDYIFVLTHDEYTIVTDMAAHTFVKLLKRHKGFVKGQ